MSDLNFNNETDHSLPVPNKTVCNPTKDNDHDSTPNLTNNYETYTPYTITDNKKSTIKPTDNYINNTPSTVLRKHLDISTFDLVVFGKYSD